MPQNDNLTYTNLIQAGDSTETVQASSVVEEIMESLHANPKHLSSRFFYDTIGSELFEQITQLPEYYPYKTEENLLHQIAPTLVANSNNTDIVELGSGDCSKISILLDAIEQPVLSNYNYYPVDISDSALKKSGELLNRRFPQLAIHAIKANFMNHLESLPGKGGARLLLFFGSTIGNLTRKQALEFLAKIKDLMQPGDQFLVGFDRVKDINVLENAYNDSRGVTAAFNKNILNVVNQHINSNFNVNDFEHYAFYNADLQRIEMHLRALKALKITSSYADQPILFKKGETIHTENSHKFTMEYIKELGDKVGLEIVEMFNDKSQWFTHTLFQI